MKNNVMASEMKFVDGIIGFAIGDALGVPVEFCSRSHLEQNPLMEMRGFGKHSVPEGTWSDDTSMVLATMDSILETGGINYVNLMDKYLEWVEEAKYTALDANFDIGITTGNAILRYKNGYCPFMCGVSNSKENGNGALMRMLPIAFYIHENHYGFEDKVTEANTASGITHGHEISFLGCCIITDYVCLLLDGVNKIDALNKLKEYNYSDHYTSDTIEEYMRILTGELPSLPKEGIKSTGYVVHTLEASLWSFLNADSYRSAVLTAINLGGDTDAIGAITGALSAMYYGRKQIPGEWLSKLRKIEYILELSNRFVDAIRGN